MCYRMGSANAEVRGTDVLKRLDLLNRDISQIILIDDNPKSSQLFPENTILIEPFNNVKDSRDTILLDLIPFLQALVHEKIHDYRKLFQDLGNFCFLLFL